MRLRVSGLVPPMVLFELLRRHGRVLIGQSDGASGVGADEVPFDVIAVAVDHEDRISLGGPEND